jgi:hypothetical protein
MLGWPKLYGTSEQKVVESICQEEGAPHPQWVGPNKDIFFQEWIDEPFQKHPVTGEDVWFNHSQVFHWTTFPAEMWYSFRRISDWRLLIHFFVVSIFTFIKYGILRYKMALNTSFGDGSPITIKEMNQIRGAIHKNMVFSRWEKGDVMCIDNFSTSHGRQPTSDKGRTVIVAWSQPHDKTQPIAQAPEHVKVPVKVPTDNMQKASPEEEGAPDLVASPDVTPFTTLTEDEATELQESMLNNEKLLGQKLVAALSKNTSSSEKSLSRHNRMASNPELLNRNSAFWKAAA